jgi:FMN phosphatase YigB (HAD superfamily)
MKAIIFDCNGVFAQNSLQENLDTFVDKFGFDKEKLLPEYMRLEGLAISGQKTSLQVCQKLVDIFDVDATAEEVRAVWVDTYVGIPNTEMIEYAGELSKNYQIYLFSNHSDLFYDVSEKLELGKLFNKSDIFISSEMKLLKPSGEAFSYVLAAIGYKPEEIIFVDDNLDNVREAIKLGMTGILFESVGQLRTELAEFV